MSDSIYTSEPIVEFEAIVTRCGCGNPDSHNGKDGPAGLCPKPRVTEDLGVVATNRQKERG